MKLLAVAVALAVASPSGEASETRTPPLQLTPKAAIGTSVPAHRHAPFNFPAGEPELDFVPKPADPRHEATHYSCSGERSLCYDPATRRIVYKPARAFMPEFPGLQRENISVRRDRIVFRYSF